MLGLIQEGKETISEGKKMDGYLAGPSLIVAAQKVEHYEISGCGPVRTMAEMIGENRVASLEKNEEEEKKAADELPEQYCDGASTTRSPLTEAD
jgi:Mn-containing catalase